MVSRLPALPLDLLSLIAIRVHSAHDLVAMLEVSKAWHAAVAPGAWRRLAIREFPALKHIITSLQTPEALCDWQNLFREHHEIRHAAARPVATPAALDAFVFTFELLSLSSRQLTAAPWTGSLTAFEGTGGPFTRMWSNASSRPDWARRISTAVLGPSTNANVMQLQHELAESIPNLGLRILVSKPTARGPRTILLYEQPFCHLSSPDVGDWLVFPAVSAPYIAPWENDSAAAFDTAGRVIGAVFPNQARSRLRIAPWIKASDGFVDELFQGRHGTVHTDEIASYLNHFAPW